MKRKRIISILLLCSTLLGYFAPFLNISYANPKEEPEIYDYRDFVEFYLQDKRGYSNLETPKPIFSIEADGKKALVKPEEERLPNPPPNKQKKPPYDKYEDVPFTKTSEGEDFVVPVGTKIKLDAAPSIAGSGGKIIQYDWQVGKTVNGKKEGKWKRNEWKTKSNPTFIPKEPGEYFIFLNVQDSLRTIKLGSTTFNNWSDKGDWRTTSSKNGKERPEKYIPSERVGFVGWYFTVAKIKVVEPNLKLPDCTQNRTIIDDSGAKKDRMIIEDKNGKRMVSLEEAKREGKKATPLKPGETYTVKMWMQNEMPPKHDTKNKGIKLNRYVAYYNGKWNKWDWSDTIEKGGGIKSLNYPNSIIPAGKTAYYEWKYTVPNKSSPKIRKEKIRLAWKIPDIEIYKKKDNMNPKDDYTYATFPMSSEDMLMDQDVILLNSKGQSVNYVQPYEQHTVIFRVWKNVGETPIKNPKATINVNLEDGAGIKTVKTITHNQILNYKNYVEFRVPVVPTTPWLKAYAIIDKVHYKKGVNDNLSNDEVEKIFASEFNLAVNNFTVTPHLTQINDSHEIVTLNFDYTLSSTADIRLTGVPVEIRMISPEHKKIYRFYYNFDAKGEITDNFSDIFDVYPGEYTFEIEINPPPRNYKEFKANSSNPYKDNKNLMDIMQL